MATSKIVSILTFRVFPGPLFSQEQDKKKEEDKALEFLHSKQEQELAMQLLKQYQAFMKENQEGEDGAKPGKEVDPNKPKRSLTAFMFFSTETRKQKIDQVTFKGSFRLQ